MEPQGSSASKMQSPVDLSHHMSVSASRRLASQVKRFYKYFQIPGIAQLAGGLPDYNFFPFDTLEGSTALPDRYQNAASSGGKKVASRGGPKPTHPEPDRVVVPKQTAAESVLTEIDLKTGLQYGTAQGYPPLWAWLLNFTKKHLHPNVPYEGGPDIILSCGNTDGFTKVMDLLNDVWIEGRDPIEDKGGLLCEEFCFTLAQVNARPRGMNIAPVAFDIHGMLVEGPGSLKDVLENWDLSKGRKPHMMYSVTMGHNPTGAVLTMERRKVIYELCVEHDVIIVEDEPYWYLQYPKDENTPLHTLAEGQKSSGFPFLDSLVPSFLSIDYQGRVLRLDTFSKTVAPGCRLGWITGQPMLIERLGRITESTTQQPSGFVQTMIAELLMGSDGHVLDGKQQPKSQSRAWDTTGWVTWLEGLRGNYQRRMELLCHVLTEGQYLVKSGRRPSLSRLYLSDNEDDDDDNESALASVSDADEWGVIERTHMYRFDRPAGGMFLWVELLLESHPLARRVAGPRLATALWVLLTEKPYLVLAGPGAMFAATPEIRADKGWRYMRLCFASVDDETVVSAGKGFADGTAAFWRIKDEKEIDRLLTGIDEAAMLTDDYDGTNGNVMAPLGFC